MCSPGTPSPEGGGWIVREGLLIMSIPESMCSPGAPSRGGCGIVREGLLSICIPESMCSPGAPSPGGGGSSERVCYQFVSQNQCAVQGLRHVGARLIGFVNSLYPRINVHCAVQGLRHPGVGDRSRGFVNNLYPRINVQSRGSVTWGLV